jgi:hypothetical protein
MKHAYSLSLLFAITGCVDSQVSDVLTTRTDDGHEVRIDVGDRTAQIDSGGRRAVLAWTDSEATLEHAAITAVFAHADETGAWLPRDAHPAFSGLGPMLGAAEHRLIDHGVVLPWREHTAITAGLACTTTSTWVWSSSTSCTDCYSAARDESGVLWPDQSRSCSVGSLYTTCSVTQCSQHEAFETPLEL